MTMTTMVDYDNDENEKDDDDDDDTWYLSNTWILAKLHIFYNGIYFKVQFSYVSVVHSIQTKGRGDWTNWMKSFRLEYSQDCVTFKNLLNVDGNNQVWNNLICLHIKQSLAFLL